MKTTVVLFNKYYNNTGKDSYYINCLYIIYIIFIVCFILILYCVGLIVVSERVLCELRTMYFILCITLC